MDSRTLCQLCMVLIILYDGITEAALTLTGSSDFAVAGESFTLTCNPHDSTAVAVFWRRFDTNIFAPPTSKTIIEANKCGIGPVYDTEYQYTCEPGPVYKVTIPASLMTNRQNKEVWRCGTIFPGFWNSAAAEYEIKVQVPVSSISIQADNAVKQQVNIIYENIRKTFHCITYGCRPKANVTVTTTGVTKGQLTESTIPQNGDLIITRVSQVITANRGGSNAKTIQCSAVNIQGRKPVTSQLVTLDVYYIPSVEPVLTGYTNGTVLYEGDSDLTLTCQQSGGYPLSVISWSCDGKTGTTNNDQAVASSYVQLAVNRNLNRKSCTCIVRHPDNNLAYTRTLSVTFTVYYAPTITLDGTNISVQEGDNTSRQCSAIGNPTPTVKWFRGSSEQTSDTGTSATLVFRNIDRNQADTYQCKATATGKLNFETVKSVSVVVYYPPSVTVTLQNTTENETNVVFTCNADGFPTNYTYHGWNQYIDKTLVRSFTDFTGMLSDSNRKITIPKVTFNDTGSYHCVVENGFHGRQTDVLQQGSSYFDVRVSAKFDPDEEASRLGELHKRVIINIKFYSNPLAVISNIKWNNGSSGNLLTNSDSISLNLTSTPIQRNVYGKTVTLTGQSAILTIASLQSFHLGRYKLQIQNGGNLSSSFNFQIIISESESPKYDTTSAAIGGAIGSVLTLIVIVVIIAVFIVYRRRTNRGKKNKNSNDDGLTNNTYADLDIEVAMTEVSPYQAIRNTDVASTIHDTDINTYEGLNDTKQESGANTYETLTNKQPNED